MTIKNPSTTTLPEPSLAERVAQLDDEQVLQAWEFLTGEQPPRVPVAYVTPAPSTSLDALTVRQCLFDLIPRSNVPDHVVVLPAVPQDAQGKADRAALRHEVLAALAHAQVAATPDVEAGDDLSTLVRQIWATHLPAATNDGSLDFFRAGGDSLSAIRTITTLNRYLDSSIELVTMFRFSRSDLFAAHLKSNVAVTGLEPAQLQSRAADALERLDAECDG